MGIVHKKICSVETYRQSVETENGNNPRMPMIHICHWNRYSLRLKESSIESFVKHLKDRIFEGMCMRSFSGALEGGKARACANSMYDEFIWEVWVISET